MFESLIKYGWQIGGSVVAVPLLVFGIAQTMSTLAHEEHSTVETFETTGLRLVDIHNRGGGTVKVVGTGADEITVRTEVSDGLQETDHSEAIDGERLVLKSSCPLLTNYCNVDYEVEMPADLAVTIWSVENVTVEDMSGDVKVGADEAIDVARLRGRLEADAVSGSVTGRDLRTSDVVASATDGSVVLEFSDAPLAVRARTIDGDIDVLVPDDGEPYRVETSTVDGTAGPPQVRTDPNGDRTIHATTTDGDVRIGYRP